MSFQLNYAAIIAGTVFTMFFSFAWYAKIMGALWSRHFYGFEKGSKPATSKDVIITSMSLLVLNSFLSSYVLALALAFFGHYRATLGVETTLVHYLELSLLLFLGFLLPFHLGRVAWEFKNWYTVFIGATYEIIRLIVLTTIFWYWR